VKETDMLNKCSTTACLGLTTNQILREEIEIIQHYSTIIIGKLK